MNRIIRVSSFLMVIAKLNLNADLDTVNINFYWPEKIIQEKSRLIFLNFQLLDMFMFKIFIS